MYVRVYSYVPTLSSQQNVLTVGSDPNTCVPSDDDVV
jgi:hypothetical protein